MVQYNRNQELLPAQEMLESTPQPTFFSSRRVTNAASAHSLPSSPSGERSSPDAHIHDDDVLPRLEFRRVPPLGGDLLPDLGVVDVDLGVHGDGVPVGRRDYR